MAKTEMRKSASAISITPGKSNPAVSSQAVNLGGAKADKVIDLLRAHGNGTLDQLAEATNLQKHPVRGFVAGALKRRHGLAVVSEKTAAGRVHRIAGQIQA